MLAVELYPITPSISESLWKNLNEKEGMLSVGWEGVKEDFSYPLQVKRFPPLFKKILREEIISKLGQLKGGGQAK